MIVSLTRKMFSMSSRASGVSILAHTRHVLARYGPDRLEVGGGAHRRKQLRGSRSLLQESLQPLEDPRVSAWWER